MDGVLLPLAYLYRQLGFVTRVGVQQMAGYLTLLEAWIYESVADRISTSDTRRTYYLECIIGFLVGSLVNECQNLQMLREVFDRLGAHKVK